MQVKILIIVILLQSLTVAGKNLNGFEMSQGIPTFSIPFYNKNLQYYGFALIDCGWDDPNDNEVKSTYVDEVSGFTNTGQMCVFSETELISERLTVFNQAGLKALLHVEPILFELTQDSSTPSGAKLSLRPNALQLWTQFFNRNRDVLTLQYITAIYVADEPKWNGLELTDFVQALEIIKTSLPLIPTLAIEAYPVVDQIMVPDLLDWVGFDRYDTLDPTKDSTWLSDLNAVRSARTRDDQKIVIVASTQWLPFYQTDAGVSPSDTGAVAYNYYKLASSDPDVIALIGYLWPGGLDDHEQLGARNLPNNVLLILEQTGQLVIENYHPPP